VSTGVDIICHVYSTCYHIVTVLLKYSIKKRSQKVEHCLFFACDSLLICSGIKKVNLKNDTMSWQPRNIPWFWQGEPVIAVPVFIPVPVVAAAAQPQPRTEKARRLKCFLCRRRDWPDPLSELYHGAACGLILCFTCVAEVYSGSRNRGPSWRPDFVLEEILTNEVLYSTSKF
jgi:hypothetical protein